MMARSWIGELTILYARRFVSVLSAFSAVKYKNFMVFRLRI